MRLTIARTTATGKAMQTTPTSERLLPRKPVRSVRQHVAERLADFAFRQAIRRDKQLRRGKLRRARPAPHEVQLPLALDTRKRIVVRVLDPACAGELCTLECGHEVTLTTEAADGGRVECTECASQTKTT